MGREKGLLMPLDHLHKKLIHGVRLFYVKGLAACASSMGRTNILFVTVIPDGLA